MVDNWHRKAYKERERKKSNPMKRMINFTISLPYRIRREGNYFVSWCYPLDVSSQGKTREEAIKNLGEAIRLFITSCYERGTLDRVLKDCGFIAFTETKSKIPQKSKDPEISVPLPFIFDTQLARCQG